MKTPFYRYIDAGKQKSDHDKCSRERQKPDTLFFSDKNAISAPQIEEGSSFQKDSYHQIDENIQLQNSSLFSQDQSTLIQNSKSFTEGDLVQSNFNATESSQVLQRSNLQMTKRQSKFETVFLQKIEAPPTKLALLPGQFKVGQLVIDRVPMSCFVFSNKNAFRIFCVKLNASKLWDTFLLVIIFLNAVSFALYDKSQQQKTLNRVIDISQYVFTMFYILEALDKIIADGFVLGKKTYLRSPVSCFDFIIVLCAISEIIIKFVTTPSKKEASFFRLMRALRTIKLLNGLYEFPQMRQQIRSIGMALKGLANVGIFLLCFFSLMAIIGLQLFSDDIGNACRITPEPVMVDGKRVWERADASGLSRGGICSTTSSFFGGYKCPQQFTCGSYLDKGMPLEDDGLQFSALVYYNVASWENFGTSVLSVFQLVTGDDWSPHMFNLMNSTNLILPVVFCFFLQILGTYFFMNLMLAVIMEQYINCELIIAKEDALARQKEINKLEEAMEKQQNFVELSRLLAKKNDATFGKKVTSPSKDLAQSTTSKLKEVSPTGETFENPILNFLATKVGDDGLTDEERSRLKKVMKSFNFEVKPANKIIRMLSDPIKKQVNNAQKELNDRMSMMGKITDAKTKQKFEDINMKALAAAQIESEEDRKNALKMVELEQTDVMIELWLDFKIGYEADRVTKFGLKDENSINKLVQDTLKKQLQTKKSESLLASDSNRDKKNSATEKMVIAMSIASRLQFESPKEQTNANKAALEIIELQKILNQTLNKDNDKELHLRANKNSLYLTCYELMNHKYFTPFISFCILGNTLALAFNKFPSTGRREFVQSSINQVFFFVFFGEMIIKMLGEGPKSYFRSIFNAFDFLIIIISTFDLILDNMDIQGSKFLGAIRVLRVFRLLRVFKLAKVWKDLNDLLTTMGIVIVKLVYLLIILLCFLMTYSILGKEFFAFKMAFDDKDQPIENFFDFETGKTTKEGVYPDFNFNTFMESVITVFSFLAVSGWSAVYYSLARMPGINKFLSFFYCYSLMIGGKMMLFQLFVAILLKEFDERSIITKIEDDEIAKKKKFTIFRFFKEMCAKCYHHKKKEVLGLEKSDEKNLKEISIAPNDEKDEANNLNKSDVQQGQIPIENKQTKQNKDLALFCLTRESKFRNFFIKAEFLKFKGIAVLNTLMWTAIIISSVQLAFDSPISNPKSKLNKSMDIINYVMTFMFTGEVIIKVISKGFLLNGKKSYLRSAANILDFVIVAFALIDISVTGVDLSFIKIIRMAKLVRPMRLVFRNENLTITIKALIAAIPKIFNLLMLTLLIYIIFGIIGIEMFAGKLNYCLADQIIGFDLNHDYANIQTEFDCLNSGGEWVKWYTNFDNLSTSMMQMFSMGQAVGWEVTMIRAIKSKGQNKNMNFSPPYGTKVYQSLFFIFWIVIGCFFLQNLFVGVVISQYNREAEKLGKNFTLTEEQKNAVETKQMLIKTSPKYRNVEPTNALRKFCFKLCEPPKQTIQNAKNLKRGLSLKSEEDSKLNQRLSIFFEYFITATILLNTVVLTLKWPKMSAKTQSVTETMNYVFTGIFIVEAIIKLLGLGKNYFKDGWNVFDFIIVVSSIIFLHPYFKKSKGTITVMRAFRVGRVFKSFKKLKQLRDIFQTILRTLPGLINVGMLILLIIYLFAIVGVQTFGDIKLNGLMHQWLNFQTLPKAFLSLYLVLTGEAWNDLLEAISMERSVINQCKHNPTYEDYVANGYKTIGCGKRSIATIYFSIYVFLVPIICMNLLIAIILSGYATIQDKAKNDDLNKMIENFQEEWSFYDPDAKGIIAKNEFEPFMFRLAKPLGFPASYAVIKELKNQFISRFEQQQPKHCEDAEGKWFFSEVLDQLIVFHAVKEQMRGMDNEFETEKIEQNQEENLEGENQAQCSKSSEKQEYEKSSESNSEIQISEEVRMKDHEERFEFESLDEEQKQNKIQIFEPANEGDKVSYNQEQNFLKTLKIDFHPAGQSKSIVNQLEGILE